MNRGLKSGIIFEQLGQNPEMRDKHYGHPITTFNLGAHSNWNTYDGERRSEIEWFNVMAWINLVEILK